MEPLTQQVAAWLNQAVETSLANDKVVDQNELVAILNGLLADGVQAHDLQAAKLLLQQSQGILAQASQNLMYAQANANGSGTVIDSRNVLPGLIGLVGVGINAAAVTKAQNEYNVASQRVMAYNAIYNELSNRADWWTWLWN